MALIRSVPPVSASRWPAARSAYIHVPFCRHRCGYCNFSVVAGRDDLSDRFMAAIDGELAELGRPEIDTLFIGGGTPTHLSTVQLQRLLGNLRERFRIVPDVEWSVEANPEDITPEVLDVLVENGVNRISLGVQSFDDQKLRQLERGHSGTLARRAIEMSASRIANVSIDLIFAAPGETTERWTRDLDAALSLPIVHLSTYALTYEKGTRYWSRRERGDLNSIAESTEVEMYQQARRMAEASGFHQYEISSFARDGSRCRHNQSYWAGRGWFAVGPGAARFVDGRREINHRSTTTYLRRSERGQSPIAESELISVEQFARERAAFGVRMIDGIDLAEITDQTGIDIRDLCGDAIRESIDEGLLVEDSLVLRLSERGILFADTVASRFLG